MGTDGYKRTDVATNISVPQRISLLLLVLALLFFACLSVLYYNVKTSEISDVSTTSTTLPGLPTDRSEDILKLCSKISENLRNHAGYYECGYVLPARSVAMKTLEDTLYDIFKPDYGKNRLYDIELAVKALIDHPEWGIQVYQKLDAEPVPVNHDTYDSKKKVLALESKVAHKSVFCRLQQAVHGAMIWIILALLIIVLLVMLQYVFFMFRSKKQQEMQKMYELVDKILVTLKKHQEVCEKEPSIPPYMAIDHVRDLLITPQDRKRMKAVWDKAVHFVNVSDSRIRVETQCIKGEEFETWRWISVTQPENEEDSKVWQGQAFGDQPFNFKPLSCLKIRNMFDPDEETGTNWHVRIQDSILEKCGDGHGIVHIAVDTKSEEGCVYVRCNSLQLGGQAFQALHGWWFAGKLVTVKFMREERYLQRFPSAATCSLPLTPSNAQRKSLSRPFFHSASEAI